MIEFSKHLLDLNSKHLKKYMKYYFIFKGFGTHSGVENFDWISESINLALGLNVERYHWEDAVWFLQKYGLLFISLTTPINVLPFVWWNQKISHKGLGCSYHLGTAISLGGAWARSSRRILKNISQRQNFVYELYRVSIHCCWVPSLLSLKPARLLQSVCTSVRFINI